MRIFSLGLLALLIACGAPPKKTADKIDTGSAESENCCCKSTPATSEDGKPVYENANRMECSTKQGTCEPDVQCNGKDPVQ